MTPARAPIFIVGTGRSGTTLLRLMLCAHPRIYITHEAAFYWIERLTKRKKMAPRRFLEAYFATKPFRWLGIEPAQVLEGLPDPLPRERLADAYAAVMRETAARYGRVRFGDKTPDPQCLPQIFRDFPDAKVLRIVRDPRSTAESMTRVPFASASVLANAAIIEDEHRQMRPFLDRILTTRLEDLLGDTRAAMARILDFIGEPWDDAVLDHARHVPDVRDMPPQPWLDSAAGDRARPEAKWKTLTPRQIRLIERVAKGAMAEGRYQPHAFDDRPSVLSVWWEGLRQLPETVRFAWAGVRVLSDLEVTLAVESDEIDAKWRRLNPGCWHRYPSLNGKLLPPPPPRALPAADAG